MPVVPEVMLVGPQLEHPTNGSLQQRVFRAGKGESALTAALLQFSK